MTLATARARAGAFIRGARVFPVLRSRAWIWAAGAIPRTTQASRGDAMGRSKRGAKRPQPNSKQEAPPPDRDRRATENEGQPRPRQRRHRSQVGLAFEARQTARVCPRNFRYDTQRWNACARAKRPQRRVKTRPAGAQVINRICYYSWRTSDIIPSVITWLLYDQSARRTPSFRAGSERTRRQPDSPVKSHRNPLTKRISQFQRA